jgi:hypothetical protein
MSSLSHLQSGLHKKNVQVKMQQHCRIPLRFTLGLESSKTQIAFLFFDR